MPRNKIRALVVDDSLFFRSMLVKRLSDTQDIEVVGEAYDPYDARDRLISLEPDVMTLDIEMPNMNGVEFLKILLPQWNIPVVVISSRGDLGLAAKKAGAADFFQKPDRTNKKAVADFLEELPRRIRAALSKSRKLSDPLPVSASPLRESIVVLGASTGGTQATAKIVTKLPKDFPGTVVVQHMPLEFTKLYAENLNRDCSLKVSEARDGERIETGKVLIAPGGEQHLVIQKRADGNFVKLVRGERFSGHLPSIDKLFFSVAKELPGKNSIGVILTGMGADGAKGLLAMRNTGSYTIGQDEKSCVVYGMPREAYEIGAVVRQAPLDAIAELLIRYARNIK